MTSVVVDANFSGRGQFNRDQLARLAAKVAGTGAELVIPEVVIWEWAEHAHSALTSLSAQRADFKVDPAIVTLPEITVDLTLDEIERRITASLPTGCRVWPASSTDLREAVRAQVLQTGAGERKNTVKTGAADQLVLLCARDRVAERLTTGAVIIATADRRLQALCRAEFEDEVICVRSQQELLAQLIAFVPAASDLFEATEVALHDRVNDRSSDIAKALSQFSMGFDVLSRTTAPSVWEEERLRLLRAEIVELHDLELSSPDSTTTRIGAARIRIFGSVAMEVVTYERIGEDDFEAVISNEGTARAMIDLPVTITFSQGWDVGAVEPAGQAEIDFS